MQFLKKKNTNASKNQDVNTMDMLCKYVWQIHNLETSIFKCFLLFNMIDKNEVGLRPLLQLHFNVSFHTK